MNNEKSAGLSNFERSIFKYNLQFTYLKRKQNLAKRKNIFSNFDRSQNKDSQVNNQSTVSYLLQSMPMTDDRVILKSFSLSFDCKEKNKSFLTQREEQSNKIIPHKFPKRTNKGKELHLFRMLKKYTEKDRFIQEQKLKMKLFQKANDKFAGIKPHLKSKPKETLLKQRYFLNRQKKKQIFLQQTKMNLGKSLTSIKVNPLKRNM